MAPIFKFSQAIFIATAFISGSAHAYSGNELYENMSNPGLSIGAYRFIGGVIDGAIYGYEIGKTGSVKETSLNEIKRGLGICASDAVKVGQIHDVVNKYLEGHPETRHFDAGFLTLIALRTAFPCSK